MKLAEYAKQSMQPTYGNMNDMSEAAAQANLESQRNRQTGQDLSLAPNQVSGSPYQMNAQRASDIMWRRDHPETSQPLTPQELAELAAWQNRFAGK